uniref:U9-agatoxin-Ao1a n=1 Tax=Agelena orientalis TaxID=293813 RepID=TXAG9_AGEOR|nr:RecName: Full=U9-agatoxin-Ao1a; Short=U9-AGTX-Ao1a; AltName: Full=AgorTX_B7a; Flags: Precursor [Agelena orientalis]AAU93683.1 toxin-like structure AgorTX_B7a precursor [Agelena orientalis]
MKLLLAIAGLFLVQTLAEDVRAHEESSFLAAVAPEEQRACIKEGEKCAGDCQCCGKWSYCSCPLFGALGCSCIIGDAMVCVRKKKECRTSDVMNTPPGGCFSSSKRRHGR